jgi:hypothetical protein
VKSSGYTATVSEAAFRIEQAFRWATGSGPVVALIVVAAVLYGASKAFGRLDVPGLARISLGAVGWVVYELLTRFNLHT